MGSKDTPLVVFSAKQTTSQRPCMSRYSGFVATIIISGPQDVDFYPLLRQVHPPDAEGWQVVERDP